MGTHRSGGPGERGQQEDASSHSLQKPLARRIRLGPTSIPLQADKRIAADQEHAVDWRNVDVSQSARWRVRGRAHRM